MSEQNKQHHSIQTMNFDVQFNSEKEAFRFQHTIHDLIKDKLLEITEQVLNELVPPHQLIKVRTLTIDLETLPLKHLEHDLPNIYRHKLREAVEALLFRLRGVSYSVIDDAEVNTPDEGLSKILSIFLKTGTLPWWAKNTWQAYINQHKKYATEKLEITKVFEIVFQSTPELLVQLIERSQDDHQVLYRLADQIPNYQLLEVIRITSPEKSTKLKRIVQDFEKISSPRFLSLSQSQVRVVVWQVIFLNWDTDNEKEIIKHILDKLLSLANHQIQQVEEYFLQLSVDKLSLNTHLATSLKTLTTSASKEKLQKEIYSSEEKIRRLLLQLMSPEEANLIMAYAKDVQKILKHLSKQQIWESILDYLWDNKQKSFDIDHLSSKVLPQLTHNWEQAAKQLQINANEYSIKLSDFSKDVIKAAQSIGTSEQVKNLLSKIIDVQQVDWFWKYGNALTKLLETTPAKVWEVLVDKLWELRKQAFTKQQFLKKTFPAVWRQIIPTVAIPSNIPALQNQKMWATPPQPIIEQLAQEVIEFKDISQKYWTSALSPNEQVSSPSNEVIQKADQTTNTSQTPSPTDSPLKSSASSQDANQDQEATKEAYNTQDIKKTEMSQALDDGKISEFIEQVLPGQSQWMSEYIQVLVEVFRVDEKIAWEQIIDFLWENRQIGFERNIFLTNSLAVITDSVSSSLDTYERWQFKKVKIQEVISHYPEFAQTNEDVILASLYQGVNQIRQNLLQQNVASDVKEVIDKVFTKGVLPAVAQVQRNLASSTNQPIVSLEETIAILIETAFNNQYYHLSQLLNVNILQRFIEQTSGDFVYSLVNQIIEIDSSLYIPDDIVAFLQTIPEFKDWKVIKDRIGQDGKTTTQDKDDQEKAQSSTSNKTKSDDHTTQEGKQDGKQLSSLDDDNNNKSQNQDENTLEQESNLTDNTTKRNPDKLKEGIDSQKEEETHQQDNKKSELSTSEKEEVIDSQENQTTDEHTDSNTLDQKDSLKSEEFQNTNITQDEVDKQSKKDKDDSEKLKSEYDKNQKREKLDHSIDNEKDIIDSNADNEKDKKTNITNKNYIDDKARDDQFTKDNTRQDNSTVQGNNLTFIDSQSIAEDLDLLIYYLQYFLIKKQIPANIINADIDNWLHVLKEKHSKSFQYFVLSLSSNDIDLLAKHTPQIIRWVDEVWKQQSKQTSSQSKTEETQTEAREKETYERIKKEIFKSVNEQQQQMLDQAIYVNNAGLIILHPYIPRLFEMLGLTEKKQTESKSPYNPQKKKKKTEIVFKGDAEKERAVYILQYLATKNEEAPEHELVLNKVLCGMEITDPFVSGQATLTDEEKETCEELLGVVVQNWTILKDSPPDTLRGSFFIREGRLEIKEGNWFLQIEESGVDVLLQHLTWSIGMIKLPWMPKIMNVEWLGT